MIDEKLKQIEDDVGKLGYGTLKFKRFVDVDPELLEGFIKKPPKGVGKEDVITVVGEA
jgi:hypothetical protein